MSEYLESGSNEWEVSPNTSTIILKTSGLVLDKDIKINGVPEYDGSVDSGGSGSDPDTPPQEPVIPMPKKGDLITMTLGNTAAAGTNNQYRVLKVNGTIAEVVAMYEYNNSCVFNSSSVTTTIGSITCQKYQGSNLDNVLNTTFYNSLNSDAKTAIVSTSITQDAWYWGDSGDPDYSGYYGESNPGTSACTISKYTGGTVTVGDRYVYALSTQDVIDYVTDTTIGDGKLQNYNIWKMFWNVTNQPSTITSLWLRSARADRSDYAWVVGGYAGQVAGNNYNTSYAARPAFRIDLSKINWS